MNNIKFGAGTVFCCGSDGLPFMLGDVESMEMMPPKFETVTHELTGPLIVSRQDKISIEVKIGKRKLERFLAHALGVTDNVLDIARDEGHGRVAHLARNGKKMRTKKKNERRAFRIAQKGC